MNHKFIITFLLVIIATVLSNSQVRGALDGEIDAIEDFEVEDMSPDLDQEDVALDLDEGHRELGGYRRGYRGYYYPSCYRRSSRRQRQCCRRFYGRARGCRSYRRRRRRRRSYYRSKYSRRGRRWTSSSGKSGK